MGGSNIPIDRAAQAAELVRLGYSHRVAGEISGVDANRIGDILRGTRHWNEVKNSSVWAEQRAIQKRAFQEASFELGRKALIQAEASLPKASFLQAVTGYAILRDKERLDAGEPTQIVETLNLHAISGLDKLANLLSQALIQLPQSIDVSPGKTPENSTNTGT